MSPSNQEVIARLEYNFCKMVHDLKKEKASAEERRDKARWQRILRVYGITKEQYDELDRGHCPICVRDWSDRVRPVVDHDHKSGEVRGILCAYCNHRLVGRHRDADLLYRMAEYVRGPHRGWIVPPRPKRPRKRTRKKKK